MGKNHEGPTLAEKRKKVDYLIKQKALEEAYNLANTYSLHEPWKAFCAYRVAYIKMLSDGDGESIIQAEKLFMEATAAKFLGPLPRIYRLAALERLQPGKQELKEAFEDVLNAFERLPLSERLESDGEDQANYRDMLRLAGYYFGYQTESVTNSVPLNDESSWMLVGNDPKLARVKCSKEFALEEMESLCEKYPEAVFFKLSKKKFGQKNPMERHWKYGKGKWQVMPHYPALRLLSLLLKRTPETIEGLRDILNATNNNFAKIKERLNRKLADLLQKPRNDIFISGRGQFPRLNPNITIFGAVET
jgi:hypothetical protein